MEFSLQITRFHCLFSCQHLVGIAPDCVNLAVMHNKPVRMRPLPAWIRVRTESGMYNRNRGFILRILQIQEERSELLHKKHTLIYNRPA